MENTNNEENNLRTLKFIVKLMGVLLAVGTIALFIGIIIKSSINKAPKNKAAHESSCDYQEHNVDIEGNIVSATTNNDILTIVTSDKNNSQKVIVYDLCSKQVKAIIAAGKY